jgi:hypothetical protein
MPGYGWAGYGGAGYGGETGCEVPYSSRDPTVAARSRGDRSAAAVTARTTLKNPVARAASAGGLVINSAAAITVVRKANARLIVPATTRKRSPPMPA